MDPHGDRWIVRLCDYPGTKYKMGQIMIPLTTIPWPFHNFLNNLPMNEELKSIRINNNLTASFVALEMGIHRATFYNIENGNCQPSLATFKKWVDVLGLKIKIVPK